MVSKRDLQKMTKKDRKEFIRNLRISEQKKGNKTKILVTASIVLFVILAGAGLWFLSGSNVNGPSVTELGEKVAAMNSNHIPKGQEHEAYNSNPPTSGPHYAEPGAGPIPCKVYAEEVTDEGVIHNLEHGSIWITYKDKSNTNLANQLKKVTEDSTKLVLSPRSKNDSNIAIASWERLLKLEAFDEQKITDFIKLYKGKAPEPLAPCG